MYERSPVVLDSLGEIAHGSGVEQFGKRGVILSLFDIGIGSTVYDYINIIVSDGSLYGISICARASTALP